jgi:hypothetical protein
MADFCKQCSKKLLGMDTNDLTGLSTAEDTQKGLFPVVLCEGCGAIQVDHLGECQGGCMRKHERRDNGDPINKSQ